jgi:hypothetical protein
MSLYGKALSVMWCHFKGDWAAVPTAQYCLQIRSYTTSFKPTSQASRTYLGFVVLFMLSTEPLGCYETNIVHAINWPEQLTSRSGALPEKPPAYILRNPEFHCRIRNIPQRIFIRNLINLGTQPPVQYKIHFNIIFPSTLRLSKSQFFFRVLSLKDYIKFQYFPFVLHVLRITI